MAKLAPVSVRALIKRLRALGFEGPYAGGRHPLMTRGGRRIVIPNLHGPDVGADLLTRVLRHADISREDWDKTAE